MSFHEKSAIATLGALIAVYTPYFFIAARWLSEDPSGIAYKPVMILAAIPLGVLVAVSHIVIAVADPKGANTLDERDRQFMWRSERIGGYVLMVGVVAALMLVFLEVSYFYIANALMLAWVLAEIADQASKIVFYRRTV
jgi:hypothetical protein